MANARFAWGIDVGNRALKAVKLVREGDLFRIDDFEVIEHETVLSQAGDNRESLIQSAIANFVQRHPIKGGAVAIGVSGQSSFARFIKLPPVEKNKIPEIVRFEAIQQIPFPLDDVEWSYQLFQEQDSPEVEVGIFAMRKDLVNRQIGFFTDVDLNIEVVQMNPLAVYNAVYYDQRITGTTMVVDLGAENTDLIIAEGETVWLRSIPIGGNNFTEALVKSFKLSFDKAEELKRNAATSRYAKQIFQNMRPIFAELVAEIQRSIGFYASVHRDSRISKVIALGGTFRLPGLQKYLQQNLQLPVERLDSVSATSPTDARMATTFNENILSTIGAYGLALQAMDSGKITSSLLPQAIQRDRKWREKSKWFVGAAALFVLGTAGVNFGSYYMGSVAYASKDDVRREIKDTLSKAQKNDADWSEVEGSGGDARNRLDNVQTLLNDREIWAKLISDIYGALPPVPATQPAQRAARDVIYVDAVLSQYVADLKPTLALADDQFKLRSQIQAIGGAGGGASSFGGASPFGGDPAAAPGGDASAAPAADATAQRGYLITIRCTTPSGKQVGLLVNNYLNPLLNNVSDKTASPARPYYVARATVVRALQLKDLPSTELGTPGSPPKQVAPPPGNPNDPNGTPAPFDPFKDPITGEDMSQDTRATLLIAVVIDPPKPAPTAPANP